jgi:exopolyphosphatase/guanosine-5'-triphosphate,3'-diphosphate pyrophosphatase
MKERIAIIDLGTNTFHLLIAAHENGNTQILHRERQAVKIGMGGINQGFITEEAIQRAIECLSAFRRIMGEWHVDRARAIGTSALRQARNGAEIMAMIRSSTGIEVRLITGNEEAGYIYYGVRSAMDLGADKSLIVDIGGGSVEFIVGDKNRIHWKQSFEIGAQRLLERFNKHDPIEPEEIIQLETYLESSLAPLSEALQNHKPGTLIGSSGTFDTLSEIYCMTRRIPYLPTQTETPLTFEEFFNIHMELITRDRSERLAIPGMIEMRVDMIVTASCLIKYLLDRFAFQNMRVSTYSLKEGVLARLAEGH